MDLYSFEKIRKIIFTADLHAILIDPGPGDALRFVHAFSTKLKLEKPKKPLLIITEKALSLIGDLLGQIVLIGYFTRTIKLSSDSFLKISRKGVLVIIFSSSDPSRLENFFLRVFLNFRQKENLIFFHCYEPKFISPENANLNINRREVFNGIEWKFIDRYDQKKNMLGYFSDLIELPKRTHKDSKIRAVYLLRFENIIPERNTPPALTEEIIKFLKGKEVEFKFAGGFPKHGYFSKETEGLIREKHLFFNKEYPDYLSQMKIFAEQFDIAIGVNSGGLDLAIAAGNFGIRVGEFHHHSLKHGADYNKFLTTKGVINIVSNSERDISNINPGQCFKAIDFFIMNRGTFPNHSFLWL